MTREYWRLEIVKEGSTTIATIYGTEEVLRGAYAELKAACEAPDGTAPKVIEIHGHTETPDMGEIVTFVKTDVVISCSLTKMV